MLSLFGWIVVLFGMAIIFIGDVKGDSDYMWGGSAISIIGFVVAIFTHHPVSKHDPGSDR